MSNKEISRYLTKEDGTTFSSDTELLGLSVNSKVKNKNSGYTFKKTSSNVFDKTPIEVETNAVLYTSQTLTDAQKTQARNNIGAGKSESVLYTSQTLTDEQKTQARQNIGASSSSAVLYTAQSLTDSQKIQARQNIGASSSSAVLYTVQTLTENQKLQARTNLGIDDLSGVPEGTIVMWANSIIPAGWSICNGQNGTPDLRQKFVLGAGGVYPLNSSGGAVDHYHYIGYHTGDNSGCFYVNGELHNDSEHTNGVQNPKAPTKSALLSAINFNESSPVYVETEIGAKTAHWNGDGGGGISDDSKLTAGNMITSRGYAGGVTAAENDCMPPYYVLYFIMKTSGTSSRFIFTGDTETEITPDTTESNIISGTWYYIGSRAPGSSVSSSSIWSSYSVVGSSYGYGYGSTNYAGSGNHPDNGTYMAVWTKISANLYRTKALVKIA